MTERNLQSVGAVALLLITLCGCGGTYDSTVSGKVTLDGATVPCGTVTFYPSGGGPAAYARILEDGSYSVHTGREEGLPTGEYGISVSANEQSAVKQTASGGPPPPGKPITPAWYRSKDTSGLKFNVESGSNEINLDLKSQPPAGWNPGRQR
ncbi:MAG: hypothetical protein AB7G28_07695 [Pirellulales bacterium]